MESSNLIGQLVLVDGFDRPMIYEGLPDTPGWTRVTFGLGTGMSSVRADFDSVMPAETPIPEKSDRIEIVKHPKKPDYRAAGPWELLIDGMHSGWHRIKREAMAAGLLRVAITEWHEQGGECAQDA